MAKEAKRGERDLQVEGSLYCVGSMASLNDFKEWTYHGHFYLMLIALAVVWGKNLRQTKLFFFF